MSGFTLGTNYIQFDPAGTYSTTIAMGTATDNNYAFTPLNTSNFSVGQSNLSITANDFTKHYDGIPYSGGNGVVYSGFENGDDENDLGGTLSYGGTSQGAVNAGLYVITPQGLTSSNYNITFISGDLVIYGPTIYVNDEMYSGSNPEEAENWCTAAGNDDNPGTISAPLRTITKAISVAQAGDVIRVDAGTYAENVVVDKRLQIFGAVNSFQGPTTFINTSTIGGNAITITADGFAGTGNAQEIQNIHCTGKTTDILTNNDYGINVTIAAYYLNLYNVYADNYRYAGLIFNGTYDAGTGAQINIWDCQFQACDDGIRLGKGMNGIYIKSGLVKNNRYSGIITDANDANILTNIRIEETQFIDNGTLGSGDPNVQWTSDIMLQRFNGNALLKDLTFNTYAKTALDIRGKNLTSFGPSGTVEIQNCTFTGTYSGATLYNQDLVKIRKYTDISGITFTGTNTINTLGYATSSGIKFEEITGTANYSLSGISFPNAASGYGLGYDLVNTTPMSINATTGVTFGDSPTNFTIEDRIFHKIDYASFGLVTWVANNNYVTTNSYYPTVNTPSVQRGIDAAGTPGWTVNVSGGTYNETININKAGLTLQNGSSPVIDGGGTGTVVTITADGVTFKGFTVQNSGAGQRAGIFLNDVDNCWIQDNTVINNQIGIALVDNATGNTITGNTVTNNTTYGIMLDFLASNSNVVTGNDILGNDVSGSEIGLYLGEISDGNNFEGNILHGNLRGIELFASDGNTFEGNQIYANTDRGVAIVGSQDNTFNNLNVVTGSASQPMGFVLATGNTGPADGRHSSGNVISGNKITAHTQFGLRATGHPDNAVDARLNWWGDITGPYVDPHNPCGLGNEADEPYNVNFSPWYANETMTTLNGLPELELSEVLDISTITKTPVVFDIDVDYPNDIASYDIAVLTDALITTTNAFPANAKVKKVVYDDGTNTQTFTLNYSLGGKTQVYLSEILGLGASPLKGHNNLIVNWKITADGFDVVDTYPVTIQSVSYIDKNVCVNELGDPEGFSLTFGDATLVLNTTPLPVEACDGQSAIFDFDLDHPVMANVSTTDILSNATIESDKVIPAGTIIEWKQTIDRTPDPDDNYTGTYNVPANTTLIYLSQIVTNNVLVTTSPFQLQESDPIHWEFDISGLDPGLYNFEINAAAQLTDGTLYPYAEMAPELAINMVGADGLAITDITDISTVASAPVIIPVTITYPDLAAQSIDLSVLTDARITSTSGNFPEGARIFKITYEGAEVLPFAPYTFGAGQNLVYLSQILGGSSPLLNHSNQVIDWKLYVDGITTPVVIPVKVEAIAYTSSPYGIPAGCYSVMDDDEFNLNFGTSSLTLNTPSPVNICYPGGSGSFVLTLNHQAIDPISNEIRSNATIESDIDLPVGTKIWWTYGYDPNTGLPATPNGSLTLTTATSTLYLSEIVTGTQGNLVSPNFLGHTGNITWKFDVEYITPATYNFEIKAAAQLIGYPLWEYNTMAPALVLQVNVRPVVATVTLQTSTDEITWTGVNGDAALKHYDMCLNPLEDYYYMDIINLTGPANNLTSDFENSAFYLHGTYPQSFFDYWEDRGVDGVNNANGWELIMWDIINGDAPMFYINYSGGDFTLVDGLQYQASGGTVVEPLRINGEYPQNYYTFRGKVTDINGCVSDEFDVLMHLRTSPVVTSVTMRTSLTEDFTEWETISGNLTAGYEMCIDPVIDFHYFDIINLVGPYNNLTGNYDENAFYIDEDLVPPGFFDYWDGRGVDGVNNDEGWQLTMWQIINGNLPMFYISWDGTDYELIDGLQHSLGQGPNPLRISGDYPQGLYTFNGVVVDNTGCASEIMTIKFQFNSSPAVTAVNLQTNTTGVAPWTAVAGNLTNGYEMCIDPVVDYYYFDISTLTGPVNALTANFEVNAFFLDVTSVPAGFYDYWEDEKQVFDGCGGTWQPLMWEIIDGQMPMFYIKYTAPDEYQLIDGLQFQAGGDGTDVLRINGEYPQGNYKFTGSVTDVNGCVSSFFDVFIEFNSSPVVSAVSMQTSTNLTDWFPVSGNLVAGYEMCIDPVIPYHYLDIDALTLAAPANPLLTGTFTQNAFYLDEDNVPEGFYAYWAAKQVFDGCGGTWQPFMWEIIDGEQPMFYIQYNGPGDYVLIDGLQYQASLGTVIAPLRVSGDYPQGIYTFGGTVTDANGCVSSFFDVFIEFNSSPVVSAVSMQTSTNLTDWFPVSGNLVAGYEMCIDPIIPYHYLDIDALTLAAPANPLLTGAFTQNAFYLDEDNVPAGFYAYWAAKQVFDGCGGTWQPFMWEIIDGEQPMFYIQYNGPGDYVLIDGLQYQASLGTVIAPLRVSGDYPQGIYTFGGSVTDVNGCVSSFFDVFIEFNSSPVVSAVSMQTSTNLTDWFPVSGNLVAGYEMCIDPVIPYHYLDIDALTLAAPANPLLTGAFTQNAFYLDEDNVPAGFYAYWAAKQVFDGCGGTWQPFMWEIIDGEQPMFYIQYNGPGDYVLIDGLQYQASLGTVIAPLRVSGDYPQGIYTFGGSVTDVNGCVSSFFDVFIEFNSSPVVSAVSMQTSTNLTDWFPVSGNLVAGYEMCIDPVIPYHYLDIDALTLAAPANPLLTGAFTQNAFYLDEDNVPAGFYAYWAAKQVFDGCGGTWQPFMWEIIDGEQPMFYIQYNGPGDYVLIDGLQYQASLGTVIAPLRVSGDYPQGIYTFGGSVTDVNGCVSSFFDVFIEFNSSPVVSAVSMQTSTNLTDWFPVSGNLVAGYEMCIDPVIPYHYLDIDALTLAAPANPLLTGAFTQNAFYLDEDNVPAGFYAYWAAKQVFDGCGGTWQPFMWEIIDGEQPMFYIQYNGPGDYVLIDGLQYQASLGTVIAPLRVSGDYPQGIYTFGGSVTDVNGCVSSFFDVFIEFNSSPVVETVTLLSSTDELDWDPVIGDLVAGYSLCIDPEVDYYYLDIDDLTGPVNELNVNFEYNAFYLDVTSVPAGFYAYWENERGVCETCGGTWQPYMWDIISGAEPMFYIKYISPDEYQLIDGLQYQTGGDGTDILRVNGDYPEGNYIFSGTVTDENECVSSAFDVKMYFKTIPHVNPVANQAYCNGASVSETPLTSPFSGAILNWTNSHPSIGLAASGTGNIPAFTAANTGTTNVVATITVTPINPAGCAGDPVELYTITVYPTPTVLILPTRSIAMVQPPLPSNSAVLSVAQYSTGPTTIPRSVLLQAEREISLPSMRSIQDHPTKLPPLP
jgi:parallel beta-helix repeat protein